jgi:hypothetical protein
MQDSDVTRHPDNTSPETQPNKEARSSQLNFDARHGHMRDNSGMRLANSMVTRLLRDIPSIDDADVNSDNLADRAVDAAIRDLVQQIEKDQTNHSVNHICPVSCVCNMHVCTCATYRILYS